MEHTVKTKLCDRMRKTAIFYPCTVQSITKNQESPTWDYINLVRKKFGSPVTLLGISEQSLCGEVVAPPAGLGGGAEQ
jgi:hypothetical protein